MHTLIVHLIHEQAVGTFFFHFNKLLRINQSLSDKMIVSWTVIVLHVDYLKLHSHIADLCLDHICPRAPYDKLVYAFPYDFWGIVGGYGLRRLCSHCVRASCDFSYGPSRAVRGKAVKKRHSDCTETVQCLCNRRGISVAPHWNRAASLKGKSTLNLSCF